MNTNEFVKKFKIRKRSQVNSTKKTMMGDQDEEKLR